MRNLEILNDNLKNTNWSNARYENGHLLADHTGSLNNWTGGGRVTVYDGKVTCKIHPSKTLLEKRVDVGFDQGSFVGQEIGWEI